MYTLELADGTTITGLRRLHHYVFQLDSTESVKIYSLLSPENLSFATLYKDGELDEVLLDFEKQNFYCDNEIIEFRLREVEE